MTTPANTVTKNDITTWLEPILSNLNLTNPKITLIGNTEKGDGYLGDISFVKVDGLQANLHKEYNFVIKSGKKSDTIRKVMPIRAAFKNEIYVYETILPIFEQFQAEKRIEEPFNNTVKCYGTKLYDNTEVLVLENMREKNYSLWNRKHPMNQEHIRKVVKTYGKLHALSFALRDQKPEVFQDISKNLVDIIKLINEMNHLEATEGESTHLDDIIKLATSKNKPHIVEKIKKHLSKPVPSPDSDSDPHFVILHGDCWNNNFMFTYSDEKREKLAEMCYLDLQLAKVSSPVMDLSYFLFTCTDPDDLVQNFDEILDCYYESLSGFLRELGSDPEKLFPHEAFLDQWRKYGKIGLLFLPSILKICLADEDEVTDLTDLKGEKTGDLAAVFGYKIKNTGEYERRSLPVIQLAIDRGFLDD